MNKYTGIKLNWDEIYRLSSEITSSLVNKASDQVELFLIGKILSSVAKANIEKNIASENWNDKERSAFWNDIETEWKKHETMIRGTMNDRKTKTTESIGDSIKKQLNDKYKKLNVIVVICGLTEKDVRDDIADSMEEANRLTKPMSSLDDSYRWWADWWYKFLMEWVSKCFTKYVDKSRALYANTLYSNYEKMRNLWLSDFEPLWVVGCDIARLTRMDSTTKSMTKFISNKAESYDKNKQESIWNWVNGFDKIALEIFDLFKQKQRKVFDSSLEWLKDYNKDSITDKLRRFLSN